MSIDQPTGNEPQADGVNDWLKWKLLEIASSVNQNSGSLENVKTSVGELDKRQREIKTCIVRTDQKLTNHIATHPPCDVKLRNMKSSANPHGNAITFKWLVDKLGAPIVTGIITAILVAAIILWATG